MRILIVEDRPESQVWLQVIIERVYPGAACSVASSLKEARQLLDRNDWHLVLVDIGLPDGSGISLVEEMQQQRPALPAIVTTIFDDDDNVFRALAVGAQGYLLKSQPEACLVQQLELWKNGLPPISAPIARRLLGYFREHPVPAYDAGATHVPLTARETDILEAIGKGLRANEVALRLGLTEQTVATYIRNLYSKLNIRSRSQATLEAVRRGLL